ncbi:MAG TPA: hypothetical protein PKV82_08685 [Anaerolineae bacterium]|nr:hypothetical protein [Anaerolineae bacterium]
MRHMRGRMICVILLLTLLTGCDSFWPAAETPTGTPAPTATSTVTPTATLALTPTVTLTPAPSPTTTVEATAEPGGKAVVVAQHEGEGLVAMAALTLVPLTPGRDYVVEVTSRAGAVAYTGSYSNAATDANGLPVLETQLLSANTPSRWVLRPPVAAPASWTYSISVQTMGGHIRVVIWDVTDVP